MRYTEFSEELFENGDLSEFVEDDADHAANAVLADTLREIQFSSDHAKVPKISVESLINLVRTKPGAEAFTLDTLEKSRKNDDTVKNIIDDIKDDENGIKYVFINPVNSDADVPGPDGDVVQTAPEKTVASMASKALDKRS